VVRALEKPPEPPQETPPPPNEEPPEPPKEAAPPVFGVTLDSTVTGDSAVAVPVGNTLATRDRTPAKPGPAPGPLAAVEGPPAFSPVSEMYVDKIPVVLQEVKANYPDQARRLGLDGKVTLRVGIDRNGKVRSVKVIKRAGHGLDEAAAQAMWRFKFTAAIAKDGRPVDIVITYNYTFQAP